MTRTFRFLIGALALIAAVGPAVLHGAERYDPRLRFQQLRTPHFTIYFHQGEEALVRRLAIVVEEVHRDLAARFDAAEQRRHTHVILVDQGDEANGWATPLPYNTIELTAAAPAPSALTGDTDDWLRLVFTHEYTHILHLDRSHGFFRGLRAVLGRAPLAFPNLFLPAWNTEGLATAMETAETGRGRLHAGDFRVIVDAAARAGRFEPLDRTGGGLVDWPGGHAAYAYGARFHEFLAERHGPGKLAELADVTAGRVPYFAGGAYQRVFGASAWELWRDFESGARVAAPRVETIATEVMRLTAHGFVTAGPRWTPDGRAIVYSVRDPHQFPALMEIPAAGGAARRLADRYLGERTSVGEAAVFFDQRELTRSVALQSDLYLLARGSGEAQRLTRHARASDPDIRRSDGSIVAVVRDAGRADLVRYVLRRPGDRWRAEEAAVIAGLPETEHAAPRWSPDGSRIAAERRRLGQTSEVIVLDAPTGHLVARVTATEGRVGEPEWTPDGRALVVSWERPSEPFNLYRVNLEDGTAQALVRLPGGARAAALSPDGSRVAFVGYTPEGYDLFTAAAAPDDTPVPGLQLTRGDDLATDDPAASDIAARAYSPWPTLLPRFWMPLIETDEDRIEIGAGTGGADVLGRHAYAASVMWSDSAAPDWSAVYIYDRWRPTLFVAVSDDSYEWLGRDYRDRTLDLGATLRFRTSRRTQTLFGAVHATREEESQAAFDRRSVRLAYQLTTARRYGYSISPEEGISTGVAVDVTRRALGADAGAATVTADFRAYPRLGGAHRVLALRVAGGASWGDLAARRVLGAGGALAVSSAVSFGRGAVGLARGFDTDDIAGYKALVLNADYRVPLLTIERGLRTWPLFLRQLHAAVFVDAAHAWVREFDARDTRLSAGAEVSLDAVLGHYLPLTFAAGVAARRDPAGPDRGAAAFARVGYAF